MRKIDYQILADIIRAQVSVNNWDSASVRPECAKYADKVLFSVARNFASRASVKREEFLRACGLE